MQMKQDQKFKICIYCNKGYSDQYSSVKAKGGTRYLYFHSECYEKFKNGNVNYKESD